ncbi:MAG: hypothetical protein Q9173_000865 [Seirophora scorigena]
MTRRTLLTRLASPVLRFQRRRDLTTEETPAEDSTEALPLMGPVTHLPPQAARPEAEREHEQRESIDTTLPMASSVTYMHPLSEIVAPTGDHTESSNRQAKQPTARPFASKLRNRFIHSFSSSSEPRTLREFLRLPGPPPIPSALPSGSATIRKTAQKMFIGEGKSRPWD